LDSLDETGLPQGFLADLLLKHVYYAGNAETLQLAERMAIGLHLVTELLGELRERKLVGPEGGSGNFSGALTRWTITRKGNDRVDKILGRDDYRGPVPVPVEQYEAQVRVQSVRALRITTEEVDAAFSRLVLPPALLGRIGPAINSGRTVFIYGPPGNGKTAISECIAQAMGREAFIPHAVYVEGEVIVVFDAVFHTRLEANGFRHDERWVFAKRPTVVVGGELTLEMLDLTSNAQSTAYRAPFQVKANSGVLFVDDFGRQRLDPQELLNRWIVPLEGGFDFLTFASGQKVKLPFDSLVVFSTNLNPIDLVDDAFLRRIRYKIPVGYPTVEMYKEIFARVCGAYDVPYNESAVDDLIQRHYVDAGRPLRACEPRDLVEHLCDHHKYVGTLPEMTTVGLNRVAQVYFVSLEQEMSLFGYEDGVPVLEDMEDVTSRVEPA
jgi:predicted ATPase with chaperone activity